jgi:hypothetical protein
MPLGYLLIIGSTGNSIGALFLRLLLVIILYSPPNCNYSWLGGLGYCQLAELSY